MRKLGVFINTLAIVLIAIVFLLYGSVMTIGLFIAYFNRPLTFYDFKFYYEGILSLATSVLMFWGRFG